MVIQKLKQIGKVKKLDKWVPHELTVNQKNNYFEVLSSYSTQKQTVSRSDCDMGQKLDFIRHPVVSSSVVGPRNS